MTAVRTVLSSGLIALGVFLPVFSFVPGTAEAAGVGVVSVKQMDKEHLGDWTLTTGGGIVTQGKWATYSTERPAGNFALIVTPPPGAEARIEVTDGGTTETFRGRTSTGILPDGGTLTFTIFYDLTRLGGVSVNSRPAGLRFELRTPWGKITGVTPYTKQSMPEGTYAVQYILPQGCANPRPFSKELFAKGRVAFEFAPICAALSGSTPVATLRPSRETARMTMRTKLAQREKLQQGAYVPPTLAVTGRRQAVSPHDEENCHHDTVARPLRRRD